MQEKIRTKSTCFNHSIGLNRQWFLVRVLKLNDGSPRIRWKLHMVLGEGQNQRQRRDNVWGNSLLVQGFQSKMVFWVWEWREWETRMRAPDLEKRKWWAYFGFFSFSSSFKKTMSSLIINDDFLVTVIKIL